MNYVIEKELNVYKMKKYRFDIKNYHKTAIKAIPKEGHIIEIGTGGGEFISMLQNENRILYGLDIIDENLLNTKQRGIKRLMKCDLNVCLPLQDDSFDAIIALEVIEHIYEYEKLFSEIYRILKKKGLFIISVPNCAYWRYQLSFILRQKVPDALVGSEGHVVRYSLNQWRRIIERHFETRTYATERLAKVIPLPHNLIARYAFFCCKKK